MRVLSSLLALALAAGVTGSCGHPEHRDRCASDPATAGPAGPAVVRWSHRRGVVVNHWLNHNYDEVHSYGGAWFDREDVGWIARHGFDHIRIRVSAADWLRADGTLDPARLAPLDAALAWSAAEKLGLIVALTEFPGDAPRPPGERRREPVDLGEPARIESAARVWRLIARHYAAAGDNLRFELVHQPNTRTPEGLIELNRRALAAIREVSRRRFVYLTTTGMRFEAVAAAVLPSDPRTGLALSYDEPESFTFQFDPSKPRVAFPGQGPHMTPAAIDADFAKLAAWAAKHAAGHKIYVAEIGVYYAADAASQRAYLGAVRAALDRYRLPWAIYDYESGCRMRGTDGTPTVAYEALGLGPAAKETRFAVVEQGKTVDHATLRVDGPDLGMRYPLDEGRARTSALVLDADGMPARYDSRTHPAADDWSDATIDESFRRAPAAGSGPPRFYVPVHDNPLALALAARWLVEHPGARLALEPRGEATAESAGTLEVGGQQLVQIVLLGLDLDPVTVWLDAERRPFAVIDGNSGIIVERHAASFAALAAAQDAALDRRAEARAARLAHQPERGILVRRARLFDPATLAVTADRSILILGDRIAEVGADGAVVAPARVEEIDAEGRFVMPGLWDSHAHLFGRARALMQLAGGVTSVREMGNEGNLAEQLRRYDDGRELGPRAVMAKRFGFDWLTSMPRVSTEAEARAIVESSARRGYAQIKVLNDIDPRLVPLLARLAHRRGLRFSGHLPGKMTIAQFIAAGADEIQHVPSLFAGQPREARVFDDEIRRRIALMARRRVALDPTLAQFEVADGPSGLSPVEVALLPRLPPLTARRVERNSIPAADQARRRAAFVEMGRAVRAAVDAGVTVVPGTDAVLPGFLLHRELELYVELGLAPARVLRMATLDAARHMKRDRRSGSIARGKDADLILIDGDPSRDISDLRRVHLVIKGGRTVRPAALLDEVSIRPAAPPQ